MGEVAFIPPPGTGQVFPLPLIKTEILLSRVGDACVAQVGVCRSCSSPKRVKETVEIPNIENAIRNRRRSIEMGITICISESKESMPI